MFDNLQNQNNSSGPQPGSANNTAFSPTAHGKGFASGEQSLTAKQNAGGVESGLDDIFAETETKEKPTIFQAKNQVEKEGAPKITQLNTAANPLNNNGFGQVTPSANTGDSTTGNGMKYIILGTFVIVVLAIVLAIWFFAGKYLKSDSSDSQLIPTEQVTSRNNAEDKKVISTEKDQEQNQAGSGEEDLNAKQPESQTIDNTEKDSDQDGLSDSEEEKLGTNKFNEDTDGDGLFDRDEVRVYKTDPLDRDTDKDGYFDGAEVKNGYNPNGSGKLFGLGEGGK